MSDICLTSEKDDIEETFVIKKNDSEADLENNRDYDAVFYQIFMKSLAFNFTRLRSYYAPYFSFAIDYPIEIKYSNYLKEKEEDYNNNGETMYNEGVHYQKEESVWESSAMVIITTIHILTSMICMLRTAANRDLSSGYVTFLFVITTLLPLYPVLKYSLIAGTVFSNFNYKQGYFRFLTSLSPLLVGIASLLGWFVILNLAVDILPRLLLILSYFWSRERFIYMFTTFKMCIDGKTESIDPFFPCLINPDTGIGAIDNMKKLQYWEDWVFNINQNYSNYYAVTPNNKVFHGGTTLITILCIILVTLPTLYHFQIVLKMISIAAFLCISLLLSGIFLVQSIQSDRSGISNYSTYTDQKLYNNDDSNLIINNNNYDILTFQSYTDNHINVVATCSMYYCYMILGLFIIGENGKKQCSMTVDHFKNIFIGVLIYTLSMFSFPLPVSPKFWGNPLDKWYYPLSFINSTSEVKIKFDQWVGSISQRNRLDILYWFGSYDSKINQSSQIEQARKILLWNEFIHISVLIFLILFAFVILLSNFQKKKKNATKLVIGITPLVLFLMVVSPFYHRGKFLHETSSSYGGELGESMSNQLSSYYNATWNEYLSYFLLVSRDTLIYVSPIALSLIVMYLGFGSSYYHEKTNNKIENSSNNKIERMNSLSSSGKKSFKLSFFNDFSKLEGKKSKSSLKKNHSSFEKINFSYKYRLLFGLEILTLVTLAFFSYNYESVVLRLILIYTNNVMYIDIIDMVILPLGICLFFLFITYFIEVLDYISWKQKKLKNQINDNNKDKLSQIEKMNNERYNYQLDQDNNYFQPSNQLNNNFVVPDFIVSPLLHLYRSDNTILKKKQNFLPLIKIMMYVSIPFTTFWGIRIFLGILYLLNNRDNEVLSNRYKTISSSNYMKIIVIINFVITFSIFWFPFLQINGKKNGNKNGIYQTYWHQIFQFDLEKDIISFKNNQAKKKKDLQDFVSLKWNYDNVTLRPNERT